MEPRKKIQVRNVSKTFHRETKKGNSALSQFFLNLFGKKEKKRTTILHDISFDIFSGEIVGVIGKNGSGKSTLLRMIAGIYQPESGRIDTYGDVLYLSSAHSGSLPKLTMRENIFLLGSLMGLSRKEIHALFPVIVSFSGLEKYLDSKVQHFSNGMLIRLNFSIIVHCVQYKKHDILLFDEVLVTGGDIEFKQKAMQKIDDCVRNSATAIIVSHNETFITKYCNRLLWVQDGRIRRDGATEEVFSEYKQDSVLAEKVSSVLE